MLAKNKINDNLLQLKGEVRSNFIFWYFILCNTLSVLIFARTNFRAFAQKSKKCAKISTVITRKGGMREN